MSNPALPFVFDQSLNSEFLISIYDNDTLYAAEVFEAFIEEVKSSLVQMSLYITNNDGIALRKILHKIKPTFSLVGLTNISQHLENLIQNIDANHNIDIIAEATKSKTLIESKLPLIEKELQHLNIYNNNKISSNL
jgi:CO dehydrogenase/acetyl-CoA synthase epsilon subunit